MKSYCFLALFSVTLLVSGCMWGNSTSCKQECINKSTGYGELKACEAQCMTPNAIVDPKEKNSDNQELSIIDRRF